MYGVCHAYLWYTCMVWNVSVVYMYGVFTGLSGWLPLACACGGQRLSGDPFYHALLYCPKTGSLTELGALDQQASVTPLTPPQPPLLELQTPDFQHDCWRFELRSSCLCSGCSCFGFCFSFLISARSPWILPLEDEDSTTCPVSLACPSSEYTLRLTQTQTRTQRTPAPPSRSIICG